MVDAYASSVAAVGTLDAWKSTARVAAPRRAPVRLGDEGLGRRCRRRRPGSGDARRRPRAETIDAIEAAGIDLDPVAARPPPPRRRGPRRATTPTRTSRPRPASRRSSGSSARARSGPRSASPCRRAGWPVHAVASRDAGRRERFRSLVEGSRAFAEADAARRRGRADHPGRPGRRHRAARRPASGCTAARRWSTRAARSAPRSSRRRWPPGRRSGRSTRSSPSPTRSGRSPRSTARRSRSRATTSSPRCWPRWPRRSARVPVRLAPGSKAAYHAAAVLAAGGFVALLDAIAELGRVAGLDEAGLAGDLRPAHRADARQRPGARHPGGPDRPDHPRRRRHARAPTSRRSRAHAPGVARRCTSPPREREIALAEARGALAPEAADGPARSSLATAGLTRYHCGPWSTASPPSTRPVRRPDSSARRRGRGSGGSGLRAAGSFQAASHPPDRPPPARRQRPRPPPRRLARDPRGASRPRPRTAGRGPPIDDALGALRARRDGPPLQRRHGAVARLRTATATSAGGIVVRYEAGRPSSSSAAAGASATVGTWTLPKGTPERRRDARGDGAPRGRPRRPASRSGSPARSTRSSTGSSSAGTRIHKTVHYFLMEPTGGDLARHDHEFEQVRWVALRRGPAPADVRDRARPRRPRRRRDRRRRAAARRGRPARSLRPATAPDVTETRRRGRPPDAAPRPPRGARRAADRVRRLADAGPVQRDPRGAPGRPRAGRPVRPVAHGRALRRGRRTPARRSPHALVTEPAGAAPTAGPTTR